MSFTREYLDQHHAEEEENDDDLSLGSVDSNDSLIKFVNFESHRNHCKLEEAISVTYPLPPYAKYPGRLTLSTLLKEGDLVPLFDGAGWAGTRVWPCAIWAIKYMIELHGGNKMSLCELGCGLGVPAMIWHQLGQSVVLSDQNSIMSQIKENIETNFVDTVGKSDGIQAFPLNWSREELNILMEETGFKNGFDLVLNCDCVYEPLYGKSWELLAEVIDECLNVNPKCIIYTSVERRRADGIQDFVARVKELPHVGKMVKVLEDEKRKLELYVTTGH